MSESEGENVRALLARLLKLLVAPVVANARGFVNSRQLQTLMAGLAAARWGGTVIQFFKDYVLPFVRKAAALSNILKSLDYLRCCFRKIFGNKDPPPDRVELHTSMLDYVKESYVENSLESPMSHHHSEILICNSSKRAYGKGFRLFDVLVVPDHVVSVARENGNGDIWITNAKKGDLKNGLQIKADDAIPICADVVGYLLSISNWAVLGVKVARIATFTSPQIVSIVGVLGKGTTHTIRPAPKIAFGYVKYGGTTLPGYSGALYAAGNAAYAMHLAGGNNNVGINIDYLRALVKNEMEIYTHAIEEAKTDNDWSLQWANDEWYEGDDLKPGVRVNYRSDDEITVEYQGRYHIMDSDKLREKLGKTKWSKLAYYDADEQEERAEKMLRNKGNYKYIGDSRPEADFRKRPNLGASQGLKSEDIDLGPLRGSSGISERSTPSEKSLDVRLNHPSKREKDFQKRMMQMTSKQLVEMRLALERGAQQPASKSA